jgi:hypothetical protein
MEKEVQEVQEVQMVKEVQEVQEVYMDVHIILHAKPLNTVT